MIQRLCIQIHAGRGVFQGLFEIALRHASHSLQLPRLLQRHQFLRALSFQQPSHGHHGRFPAQQSNVRATVTFRCNGQCVQVQCVRVQFPFLPLLPLLLHIHMQSKHLFSGVAVGQPDINSFFQPSSHCFVNVPGTIGGRQHHDGMLLSRNDAVHFRKEHTLQSSVRIVFRPFPSGGGDGVNFIQKHNARCKFLQPRQREQGVHDFFTFTAPLVDDGGGADVEKGDLVAKTTRRITFRSRRNERCRQNDRDGKRWNNDRGFGFIGPDAGGDDIFCHANNITDGNALQEGSKVTYDECTDDRSGKLRADNVAGGCYMERSQGGGRSPTSK